MQQGVFFHVFIVKFSYKPNHHDMIKNFFVNAFRNMRKQRGYIILNVGGLAIGLTSFLFITLYVMNELSYDRFHKNYENIYGLKVVGRLSGGVLDQAVTCCSYGQALVSDYPEVLIQPE